MKQKINEILIYVFVNMQEINIWKKKKMKITLFNFKPNKKKMKTR